MTKDNFITYCYKQVQNFIKIENGNHKIIKQWRPINISIIEKQDYYSKWQEVEVSDLEPEPTFEALDTILELFWEDITLLEYNSLLRDLSTRTMDGDEIRISILLSELYDYLVIERKI